MNEYTKKDSAMKSFAKLLDILSTLRGPGGCPWDRKQTVDTLKHNLIEEAYETIDAIDSGDADHVREELGDLYLLVTMISIIEEEHEAFSVADVLDEVSAKLIRRHPHVFGDVKLESAEEVLVQWNAIKEKVEGRDRKDSVLDGVSRGLPPLERALKLQKKAAKSGFDWKDVRDVRAKVDEELGELDEASGDVTKVEQEVGDLLFSIVNLCRFLEVDPAAALHKTNEKFIRRFKGVERGMAERGLELSAETFEIMDELWNLEKATE
jgi:tetrapyrrole methylase family protein/MazG family protein